MRRLAIRWKLTLWYGAVLTTVLIVFGGAVFLIMRHHLLAGIDQGLTEELADVLYEVNRATTSSGLYEWLDRRFGRHEGFDFQITTDDGERFFANQRLGERRLPLPPEPPTGQKYFWAVPVANSARYRVVSVWVDGPDGPLTVQVARSMESFDHELSELLFVFSVAGPLAVVTAAGGGYFLARRALAPVHEITLLANRITVERLNERIEVENADDELGALAKTLNGMIERLQRSFDEIQRFTADAAHELRTPLTIIRNEAEVALRWPRGAEDYCRVLESTLEEATRLSELADQLLFLSRQDAGLHAKTEERVDFAELLADVTAHMQVMAGERGTTISLLENSPCHLLSDGHQLRRLLYNLLDNAVKYTRPAGRVSVHSIATGENLRVTIEDTGVGIAHEHLPHIFERFYRSDPSRSADGHGAGLGLSICQSIVRGLGGHIDIRSRVGEGTSVTLELPVHVPKAP